MDFLQVGLMLAQTVKEKKLSLLYIGLFAAFLVMLVVDMYGQKKWTGSKVVNKTVLIFLAVALVAFLIAFFTLN